jgi:alpha-D-ribose 1-methylphosphonate 5-phosphate C-P lyase
MVNGRYVMSPSPIPRWDVKKLHQADHLTILSAGREKRIYAVPPYTNVEPLVFDDVPYRVEDHQDKTCYRSDVTGFFMNELPQDGGASRYELSDSHFGVKQIRRKDGEAVEIAETWYKNGRMD